VDLDALTVRQADRIHGRLLTFVVPAPDDTERIDGREVYELDDQADGVLRTAWLLPNEEREDGPLVVRGRLMRPIPETT
jgi:hypothetical protein